MARESIPAADALLDVELPVLDHGFVRLVDYMGGDARIVQSARVSYGAGTRTVREDRGLIQYLMRHLHTSPFEQVQLSFHIKLPVFVARQWIRHRTARVNEVSGRYSVMKDEFYLPDDARIQEQSADNKQGSGGPLAPEVRARSREQIDADQRELYAHYEGMLADGMARELARLNLPLSLYTEWYWQIDLHNLFHFLKLRLDAHAQYEIRAYGEALARCAQAVAPLAYEAFEEYTLHGARFGQSELKLLRQLLAQGGVDAHIDMAGLSKLPPARLREFKQKLWGAGEALDTPPQ